MHFKCDDTPLTLEEARARIWSAIEPMGAERVSLAQAHGRFMAERVVCPIDLPGFDNAAMDGYAVRADDVRDASPARPVALRLVGRTGAGEICPVAVSSGQCVRIATGAPLPQGADAVVMQEDTQPDPDDRDTVRILTAVATGQYVRRRGEDVSRGATLAQHGDHLSVGRIWLLAAAGLSEVVVRQRPVVALLATGSELQPPGQPLAPGQVHDSNRAGLAMLLEQTGAIARLLPMVPDSWQETCQALEHAVHQADVVLTSGGVSVGARDMLKEAWLALGGELEFWRVAIRPGKPFVFGQWKGKYWFGLPGNPVSAFVTFIILVRPALLRLLGATEWNCPTSWAILQEPLVNAEDRRAFLRVTVDDAGKARSAGGQASHLLSSLATANGLVEVPPHQSLAAGALVRVFRWL